MGEIVHQEPCPRCRADGRDTAGDNLCTYEDGGKTCHACGYFEAVKNKPRKPKPKQEYEAVSNPNLPTPDEIRERWSVAPFVERGYSKEAVEFYGCRVRYVKEQEYAYAYPSVSNGEVSGYQVRKLPKQFMRTGEKPDSLFGVHAVPGGGKMIIIVEGPDDVLAGYDLMKAQGKKYRIVGAWNTSGWKMGLEFLETFDKVCICFDQDDAGKKAAKELAEALTPGKGHIATWRNAKDATDLLRMNRSSEFLDAINNAKAPDVGGIISGEAAWEIIKNYTKPEFIPYPDEWQKMNEKAEGLRRAEISLWTAGSSIGKTSFIRRIKQQALHGSTWNVADVELEEQPVKTIRGMMQFHAGKRLYQMTEAERRQAFEQTYGLMQPGSTPSDELYRLMTMDYRANSRAKDLLGYFRWLHYSKNVDMIFLDHVTLGVREFGEGNEGIDAMMEDFLTFVEQTGVHLALISHLRKSPGGSKSWSQGAVPAEEDMKGSGSLYQIAFDIIGMSRNKQHEDEYIRNVTQLHVLKCRETGNTGPADKLWYNAESGLIEPADELLIDSIEGGAFEEGSGDF